MAHLLANGRKWVSYLGFARGRKKFNQFKGNVHEDRPIPIDR
jgi:hypothetical protein